MTDYNKSYYKQDDLLQSLKQSLMTKLVSDDELRDMDSDNSDEDEKNLDARLPAQHFT